MNSRRGLLALALISITSIVALPVSARAEIISSIERIRPDELEVSGFELSRDQTISIEATGIHYRSRRHDLGLCSAWILDASSRAVVWELVDAKSEEVDDDLRRYTDEVTLAKGRYEVYYSTFPDYRGRGDDDEQVWGKWFDFWKHDYDYDDFRRASRKFKIEVSGEGKELSEREIRQFHDELRKRAIVSFTELERDVYEKRSLTLERDMTLHIYAIGEANRDGDYDTSWIVDTKTNEKVWQLTYRESDRAGGAKKNREFNDTVSLKAGAYAVFCVTDDSHYFDHWNQPPPYDPFFWGVTISAVDPAMARYAKVGEYEPAGLENVVVQFVRLGDDEFASKGFTLKAPTELRVYAIGEGKNREMYDYSWIVDAKSRDVVWKMDYRDTEDAGGGKKNRMVNEVITLEKGDYIAYVTTDDSHSYHDWNTGAPHDQEHWGLTIMLVNPNDRKNVADYVEEEDPNVLAKIVKIGDNAMEKERFKLDKPSTVRIYAIGEGRGGAMYDYAWIENDDTGKVVWEMTYRKTEHAGGDKKNRMFNETIHLDAGDYIVYYESDGSHSFKRWNARPPADMWNWGVTVTLADGM